MSAGWVIVEGIVICCDGIVYLSGAQSLVLPLLRHFRTTRTNGRRVLDM